MYNTIDSPIAGTAEAKPLERRRNPRFAFIADLQVFEPNSGIAIQGRTSDLSCGGCYVDTINPLPPTTSVKLRLTKWDRSFEAHALVVYSAVGMGMGLAFVAVDQEQRRTLESWMDELRRQQFGEVEKEATQDSGSNSELKHEEKLQMKILRIAAALALAVCGTISTHAQSVVSQQWTIVTTSESAPNAVPITTTPTGAPDPCTTGQNDNSSDSNPSCFDPLVITTDWQLSLNSSSQTVTTPNLANTFTNSICSVSGGVQSISVTGMNINDHPYKATVTVTLIDSNGGVDTIVFTGKNSPDQTQFSGSFTSSGSCMNSDQGSFQATLSPAINGTYQGSFETNGSFSTSNSGTVSINWITDSNFNVSGTVTAAHGSGLCFSNLTIASTLANTYAPSFATGDTLQAIATDNSGNVVLFAAGGTDGNGLPEGNDQNRNPKLYLTYTGLAGACSGISGVDIPFSKVVPPHAPKHRPIRLPLGRTR
jgi:hypothetical protein